MKNITTIFSGRVCSKGRGGNWFSGASKTIINQIFLVSISSLYLGRGSGVGGDGAQVPLR